MRFLVLDSYVSAWIFPLRASEQFLSRDRALSKHSIARLYYFKMRYDFPLSLWADNSLESISNALLKNSIASLCLPKPESA